MGLPPIKCKLAPVEIKAPIISKGTKLRLILSALSENRAKLLSSAFAVPLFLLEAMIANIISAIIPTARATPSGLILTVDSLIIIGLILTTETLVNNEMPNTKSPFFEPN